MVGRLPPSYVEDLPLPAFAQRIKSIRRVAARERLATFWEFHAAAHTDEQVLQRVDSRLRAATQTNGHRPRAKGWDDLARDLQGGG